MNAKRGGSRKGAGRKAKDGRTGMKRYNVTLDTKTVATLRQVGLGNLSEGVRIAAAVVGRR
jgi:hypothetical protein